MVKKEAICTVVAEILAEEMSKEEGLQISVFELQQRRKINDHLKDCLFPECQKLRVERINQGLY